MIPSGNANALVQMHSEALARGSRVTVDAGMFTLNELVQLVRAASASRYKVRLMIRRSSGLSAAEKKRITAAATQQWRIQFC